MTVIIAINIMIFDTHAHLNFPDFNKDRKEVIDRCIREEVSVLNVGTDHASSKEVIEIAKENKMYASIGLHPLHIKDEDFSIENYKKLYCREVVAVGETGLDRKGEDFDKQVEVFKKHIKLAKELQLPIIIHCRGAHKELISLLKEEYDENLRGVVHCFTGSRKEAKEYIDMGFYLGINGIIFKMNLKKVIKDTSLNNILLETDCPFLTPPNLKTKRNEPIFIKEVAKEIASIKEIKQEEVERVTTENGRELFKLA